jgi:alkaline phosphatase D
MEGSAGRVMAGVVPMFIILSLRVAAATPPTVFTHGVSSGEVTQTSAVLWTRVDRETPVQVEISTDPGFKSPEFKQTELARAANDLTVKVTATDLRPGQLYFYRWRHGSAVSEVGTFKTAPAATTAQTIRFAWTGDSDPAEIRGERVFGDWLTLEAARAENLDFFVYLGDTIYSDSRAGGLLPDALTLDEFRQIYREARDVAALRNLMREVSVYAQWDDHEVRDDWDGATVAPDFFRIGLKSFEEYLPVAPASGAADPDCAGSPRFRAVRWGSAVELFFLDTRTCRSADVAPVCTISIPGFGLIPDPVPTLPAGARAAFGLPPTQSVCLAAIFDTSRTMLGPTQKAWLRERLKGSTATFKFVVSPASIGQAWVFPYDSWEGYGAERTELLNFIRAEGIANVIFLVTDLHMNLINEVFVDKFTDQFLGLPAVAHEVITGPIATLTQQNNILRDFGPSLGPTILALRHALLDLAGASCRHLNVFSYGSVAVDATAGTAIIALKDSTGQVIHDQLNPAITCTKTLGP